MRANATPVVRNGRPAGYMSVRTKPTRDEVAAAEVLYRDFRAGRAGSRTFHKGLIVRTGLMAWRSVFQVMPVRWRIRLAFMVLLPLTLGAAWGAGLSGAALGGFAAAQAVALALGPGGCRRRSPGRSNERCSRRCAWRRARARRRCSWTASTRSA